MFRSDLEKVDQKCFKMLKRTTWGEEQHWVLSWKVVHFWRMGLFLENVCYQYIFTYIPIKRYYIYIYTLGVQHVQGVLCVYVYIVLSFLVWNITKNLFQDCCCPVSILSFGWMATSGDGGPNISHPPKTPVIFFKPVAVSIPILLRHLSQPTSSNFLFTMIH